MTAARHPARSLRSITASFIVLAWMTAGLEVAAAHSGGTTGFAAIIVSGHAVRYSLTLSPGALPPPLASDMRQAQSGRAASRERVLTLVRGKIVLSTPGGRCVPTPGFIEPSAFAAENVTLVVDFACPAPMSRLTIRDDVFDELGPDHHTLARIELPGGSQQFAFAPDLREAHFPLGEASPSPRSTGSFFLLGIHHILGGYDHLLFLLGLLLRGGGLVSLLKIVTAFTLAHSVTLALAVLDLVVLPGRLVEAVIALSIAYVAAENLFLRHAASRRWVVSFLFGLVHGFGFSSVLRELGLPREGLAVALLGFNLGVEGGQALVVSALLPLLVLLGRTSWNGRLVWSSSLGILLMGVFLFFERLLAA